MYSHFYCFETKKNNVIWKVFNNLDQPKALLPTSLIDEMCADTTDFFTIFGQNRNPLVEDAVEKIN